MDRRCIAGAGTASLRLAWTRTYTADGLVTSVAFDGTGSGQGSDTLTYTYDGMGRPDQLKRGATVLTDSAWNPDGTLTSRADGSLGTSAFTYDWADRLTAATSPLYSGSTGFAWRLDGLLAGRSWPGLGDTLSAAYDAAKRPTELAVGDVGFERTYARDGLVTGETATIGAPPVALDTNAETQAFSYDGLGRLTASDLPGTARDRAYAYDRNGNRTGATLGATVTTYAYDRSDALVSQSVDGGAAASFGYDRSGNLTTNPESQAGATSSTYDLGDRLTGIDPPGQAATSFSFDALGRQRTRVTPAGSDTYDYVGAEELVWRITTGAASVTSAIDAAGNRAATASGGATGYLVPDLHGNFAAALSPAGSVINAIRYDGYGVTLDQFSSAGIATPWRFQGRLDLSPDAATPLYDLSARNYSPGIGAFTSFDSVRGQIAEPLSMNRYLYAHASPSTLTDPTGQAVYMKDGGRTTAGSYRVARTLLESTARRSGVTPRLAQTWWRVAGSDVIADKAIARSKARWESQGPVGQVAEVAMSAALATTVLATPAVLSRVVPSAINFTANVAAFGRVGWAAGGVAGAASGVCLAACPSAQRAAELMYEFASGMPSVSVGAVSGPARNAGQAARAGSLTAASVRKSTMAALAADRRPLSAARLVSMVAQDAASVGEDALRSQFSRDQNLAASRYPYLDRVYQGTTVHNNVDRALQQLADDRFVYNASLGPDYFDTWTNTYIELTTWTGSSAHYARYGNEWGGLPLNYAAYELP